MKKIIQNIVMVIIVAFMCLIFGRSSVTGSNNLAWLFIVVLANVGVIWYDFSNYAATWAKQLVITLPFVITLIAQGSKIRDGLIPETCQVLWHNYAIAYAICFFNLIIYYVNQEKKERDCISAKEVGHVLAILSEAAIFYMTFVLLSEI